MTTTVTISTLSTTGLLLATALLSGCASGPANDPWQSYNQNAQYFNDRVDRNITKPIAKGYHWITNDAIDTGISNFFSNMNDIGVTINDFLQAKFSQGGMDAGRLVVNSTLGVAGFVDVAQHINLPKHKEDFGQTLGYWGVPSGPYLVLPFFGPSSPRDAAGIVGDAFLNPLTYVSMFGGTAANAASAGAKAVDIVDTRADLMTTEKIFDEATSDSERYEFLKNTYQQKRESLVNDGKITDDLDDDYDSVAPTSSTSNPGSANAPAASSDPAKRHLLELTAPAGK